MRPSLIGADLGTSIARCHRNSADEERMPKVGPSDVVAAIDHLFGPQRNPMNMGMIQYRHRAEVQALLALLDEVPRALITLSAPDYVRFQRCRASLSAALATWTGAGHGEAAQQVEASDPIALLSTLLRQCPDALPPPVDLSFVSDLAMRGWIEERGAAAWIDFAAGEWLGTAVMAGSALEGLLLWCLRQEPPSRELERANLSDLIGKAEQSALITPQAAAQARMASDARNLVHPGKVKREGRPATRSTALAALAALDAVTEALAGK